VNYLEELAQNLHVICAQLLTQGGKILKGNTMSGMSLYRKLLKYHRSCQQIMQSRFVRRCITSRQYNAIFSVLCPLEKEEYSVTGSAVKGGTDG
jgi:hypothetical protein